MLWDIKSPSKELIDAVHNNYITEDPEDIKSPIKELLDDAVRNYYTLYNGKKTRSLGETHR